MEQKVNLGARSYSICIDSGLITRTSEKLRPFAAQKIVVIADDRVGKLYGRALESDLNAKGLNVEILTFPEGEPAKSIGQASEIWNKLLVSGIDRNSLIVALGGGVTGDLAGFVAATILRGIRFVQIPTTLLAQVDSSVGGKVGINLPNAKNIVGAFWQPSLVLIDPDVLQTLDQRQFNAGMAEVIKYGVIMDRKFFEFLEANVELIKALDIEVMTQVIAKCCQLKAQVVEEDEKETSGRRVILNYGHTFGHAIEKVFGYGHYLHGEAIAIGMTMAARLSTKLNSCPHELLERQTALFEKFDLPVTLPANLSPEKLEAMIDNMRLDKKSTGGRFNLVLPKSLGCVEFVKNLDQTYVKQAYIGG